MAALTLGAVKAPDAPAARLLPWFLTAVILAGMGILVDQVAVGSALAAAALVIGIWTHLVAWRFARTANRMTDSLDRMAAGDPDAKVEEGGAPELAALARAVNQMAERLAVQITSTREAQGIRDRILSAMDEGVLLFDADERAVFANRSMDRHLGARASRVGDLLPGALQEAVREARREERPVPVDVELPRPSRSVRGSAVPVGEDGSVLLVLRDVTQARRLDAVRRDFVTNASHELKTPAAAIQASAETIREAARDDPDVVPRFAEQLEREAIRLSRIVADLLDLSRLESGFEAADVVRLSDLVREETARSADRAAELGLDLSLEAGDGLVAAGSARDLTLLVRNLVDNAIQYTRPGGQVRVSLAAEDGEAVLRVRDTGIGIPSRDLPRIFERFYRVDRARSRETGGTGLGLSIVKHVAENHGGSVKVTSELGRGSEFEVRLPILGRAPGSGGTRVGQVERPPIS
jgi:two-component system, OmpR family, phosphate regulon sensor histidine kinase PhoR